MATPASATVRGVTWDRIPQSRPAGRWALVTVLAMLAAGTAVVRPAPAGALLPPLPDLTSVEQVIGTGQAWVAGGTGQGVDVAVVDTGVTPVPGLNAPNKVVYGPDLSFDSQNPSLAYLDGYGHGTAMAGIIAGNDGVGLAGYSGVAPNSRIVSVKVGASNGATDVS